MSVLQSIRARFFGPEEEAMGLEAQPERHNKNKIVMYTTRFCPYCMRARALLQQKQIAFRDIAVDGKPTLRQEMVEKSGRYTVPQIWVGETHIGGCDELMMLDRTGRLNEMLASNGDENE